MTTKVSLCREQTKRAYLWSLVIGVGLLFLVGTASSPSSWLLLLLLGMPASLYLYAVLHEHLHNPQDLAGLSRNQIGGALSATIGFSWQLYAKHHRNHHAHGDGPKDYSSTRTPAGQAIPGWLYLLKHGIWPFVIQWIPFISVLGMKAANRSALTYYDEGARVGLRVVAWFVGGLPGLALLLTFQGMAAVTILSLNYFQHFGAPVGRGNTWDSPWFNLVFLNLGRHDHHHLDPARRWYELRLEPDFKRPLPRLTPHVLYRFLFKPEALEEALD